MPIVRSLTPAVLAAALALPFGAPLLCAAFNPSMTAADMAARHVSVAVGDHDAPGMCSFADCASASAAPTVDLVAGPDIRAVVSIDVAEPGASLTVPPGSPTPPPPRA